MKTIRVTVAEFKKIQGLHSQVEANSIINLLKSQGKAIAVGKQSSEKKGKPAIIYEIPQHVDLVMFNDSDVSKVFESEVEEVV